MKVKFVVGDTLSFEKYLTSALDEINRIGFIHDMKFTTCNTIDGVMHYAVIAYFVDNN